jgi:hypothetical protein
MYWPYPRNPSWFALLMVPSFPFHDLLWLFLSQTLLVVVRCDFHEPIVVGLLAAASPSCCWTLLM